MIGKIVQWRHEKDGAPTRDLSGVVVACALNGTKFLLLVQDVRGELVSCEALDVRVVSTDLGPAPAELVDAPSPAALAKACEKPEPTSMPGPAEKRDQPKKSLLKRGGA